LIIPHAGEMGSGKSSLVNLLLGLELMPTSDLQCTATIVEISYGTSPQVTAHFLDDSSGKSREPYRVRSLVLVGITKLLALIIILSFDYCPSFIISPENGVKTLCHLLLRLAEAPA
jgi:hypothetical protein